MISKESNGIKTSRSRKNSKYKYQLFWQYHICDHQFQRFIIRDLVFTRYLVQKKIYKIPIILLGQNAFGFNIERMGISFQHLVEAFRMKMQTKKTHLSDNSTANTIIFRMPSQHGRKQKSTDIIEL